jgi:hypothetical protein
MPLSPEILSLDPRKVDDALVDFFQESLGAASFDLTTQALMHRIANYVYIANKNKALKKEGETELSLLIQAAKSPQELAENLQKHAFTPALTAHPTNPKAVEVDDLLVDIYNVIMMVRNEMAAGERDLETQTQKNSTIRAKLLEINGRRNISELPHQLTDVAQEKKLLIQAANNFLKELCVDLSKSKLQPDEKLTVPQEVARNLDVFAVMFKQFNKFKHRVIDEYCKVHAIPASRREEIAASLTRGIARQFQEVHFWSASDADGNDKVTHQTMLAAIHDHQKFLDELYLQQIESIKTIFVGHELVLEELSAIQKVIKRVEEAEAAGAVEQQKDSAAIVVKIDALISQATGGDTALDEAQKRALQDLKDSFDCFGFVGPKLDVRQSSFRNATSMQQILEFLREKTPENVAAFPLNYGEEGFDKKAFTQLLVRQDVAQFIAENIENLGDVAKAELKRMEVAKQHPDIVHRYIISDNKGVESWNEVRALEAIAYRAANPQEQKPDSEPLQVYPLCETKSDIDNLPKMIAQLLKDPESVKTLHGRLDLFIGYSDAEKRAGIGALALLQKRVDETMQIIEIYNEQNPEAKLRVEIFHGRGNDIIRGGDKLSKLTTDQGQGAIDLEFQQALKSRLETVVGHEDDAELQIKQWRNLDATQATLASQIIEQSTMAFEEFVSHGKAGQIRHGDNLSQFLQDASMSEALAATNQSSRKKAKGAGEKAALNLDSERAIGLATRFSACGIHANTYHGMSQDFPQGNLPELFEKLTVFQDMVYKTFYALAITDFSRAEIIAEINQKELNPEMLAELRDSAFSALKNCVKFLPLDQARAGELLGQIDELKQRPQDFSISEVTQRIMSQLPEFPVIKELLSSAQDNKEHYQDLIHQKLNQYKDADLQMRAKLDSDFAVLFREEMRIPNEINSLTTKTQSRSENVVKGVFIAGRPIEEATKFAQDAALQF